MNVLLISCYDLGHQPFAVASASAHLLERGHHVECLDLAVQDFDEEKILGADVVGISIPMHTACLLYTSPSPRDGLLSRMPSSA